MRNLAVALAFAAITFTARAQVLYNITFDSPGQPVNSLVRVGSAPDFVSSIPFGTPTVVGAFGGLSSQPLRFDMISNTPSFYYDQIRLDLSTAAPASLDLSFDFTSAGLIGAGSNRAFTVLFDTPGALSIGFDSKGKVSTHSFGADTVIGSYADTETFRCLIHLDMLNHVWSVTTNGTLMASTPFMPFHVGDTNVQSIRFNYGLLSGIGVPDFSGAAAIDNVLVVVPEPGALSIAVFGPVLLRLSRRSRSRIAVVGGPGSQR